MQGAGSRGGTDRECKRWDAQWRSDRQQERGAAHARHPCSRLWRCMATRHGLAVSNRPRALPASRRAAHRCLRHTRPFRVSAGPRVETGQTARRPHSCRQGAPHAGAPNEARRGAGTPPVALGSRFELRGSWLALRGFPAVRFHVSVAAVALDTARRRAPWAVNRVVPQGCRRASACRHVWARCVRGVTRPRLGGPRAARHHNPVGLVPATHDPRPRPAQRSGGPCPPRRPLCMPRPPLSAPLRPSSPLAGKQRVRAPRTPRTRILCLCSR